MKLKIIFFLIISMVTFTGTSFGLGLLPKGKVTLKVTDESGNPVPHAEVFMSIHRGGIPGEGTQIANDRDKTDQKGFYTVTKRCTGIGFQIDKKGYYSSGAGSGFKDVQNYLFYKRWLPWNPTIEIVLREKRNPVKMYRTCTGYVKVPVQNVPIGYDLVKGDWVKPYGKGEVKDFIFVYSSRYENNRDWEGSYKMYFSNEGDGFYEYNTPESISSEYKWPYEAPEKGYDIKELKRYRKYYNTMDSSKESSFTNLKKDQQYIFRVRTKYNSAGEVTGGLYGRKTGDFHISQKGTLSFCYFLNPENRSLEYGGNLFEDSDY